MKSLYKSKKTICGIGAERILSVEIEEVMIVAGIVIKAV